LKKAPIFTVRLVYPPLVEVPLDAATLPTDPVLQMLVREASKPGREGSLEWTAISTSQFAKGALETEQSMEAITEALVVSFMCVYVLCK
jgi:predicted NAD/FAD-dependent oxidoreductase